ncbi:MAG: hypothetical protein K2R93_14840 [Gemmatimonadaceae bacterium]|nr:hypothetical protein [Gemmatimonadaceae bacterium]
MTVTLGDETIDELAMRDIDGPQNFTSHVLADTSRRLREWLWNPTA